MKFLNIIRQMFTGVLKPLKDNGAFLVFMYILGLVTVYAVVPDKRGYHAYRLAPQELFVDVCLLCMLLWLFRGNQRMAETRNVLRGIPRGHR